MVRYNLILEIGEFAAFIGSTNLSYTSGVTPKSQGLYEVLSNLSYPGPLYVILALHLPLGHSLTQKHLLLNQQQNFLKMDRGYFAIAHH